MSFASKRIELWDSYGLYTSKRQYLEDMCKYLFHEFHKPREVSDAGSEFAEWKKAGSRIDQPDNCPQQENDDDCGLFMLIFIYLMSQGVQLNSTTFTQSMLDANNSRARLAYIIWKSGWSQIEEVRYLFNDWYSSFCVVFLITSFYLAQIEDPFNNVTCLMKLNSRWRTRMTLS